MAFVSIILVLLHYTIGVFAPKIFDYIMCGIIFIQSICVAESDSENIPIEVVAGACVLIGLII